MQFIKNVHYIQPKNSNGIRVVYMHGYGGHTWQASRQLNVLANAGYTITALDFKKVLHTYDPAHLIGLMDEVDSFFKEKNLIHKDTVLVGISLGGLVGYNMLRRHKELHKLLVITGGNISLLPSEKSLANQWRMTRQELAKKWEKVNMYTPVGTLRDKHMIMLLPLKDKIIDPDEVAEEIKRQQPFNFIRVIRTKGGHYRTIIRTTILRPRSILPLLKELEQF